MKVEYLADILDCKVVAVKDANISDDTIAKKNIYIGDLLSIVMSKAKSECIWITIQTHLNVVAVAELVDMSCIIVVENMEIDESTIKKAEELSVPILKSERSAFDIATMINKIE